VEEQDKLAAQIRQSREERKSREESLERTAEDEGQSWSGQHRLDFSDEEARVQQEKNNILIDHTAACKSVAKKVVVKVMCTGRGKGTLAPVEEDEKPQQKMKQHDSCDRDVTPSGEEYDGEEDESSEEEEEKKEHSYHSDESSEEEEAQQHNGSGCNASRSRSRSRRRSRSQNVDDHPAKKAKKPKGGEPKADTAGGTAWCDCGQWRTACGLPPGKKSKISVRQPVV